MINCKSWSKRTRDDLHHICLHSRRTKDDGIQKTMASHLNLNLNCKRGVGVHILPPGEEERLTGPLLALPTAPQTLVDFRPVRTDGTQSRLASTTSFGARPMPFTSWETAKVAVRCIQNPPRVQSAFCRIFCSSGFNACTDRVNVRLGTGKVRVTVRWQCFPAQFS
jgi:hypothetical protein